MKIRPKKWDDFQHYRDRDPKWIKLHRKLLDDVVYQRLPRASQALAPMLWLLASEHPEGLIDANPGDLAFRLRWPEQELSDALSPLIGKGFFDVVQFDSNGLARPEQVAIPERERELEKERENPIVPLKRDVGRQAKAERLKTSEALIAFLNGRAGKHFRPVPANLKFIEARLAEGVTVQDLKTLIVRKCRDWLGTDMEKFLRPETLFNATKCQQYLGEIPPEESCSVPNASEALPQAIASAHVAGRPSPTSERLESTPTTADVRGSQALIAAATRAVSATAPRGTVPGIAATTSSAATPSTASESSSSPEAMALGLVAACQKLGIRASHLNPTVQWWANNGVTPRDIEVVADMIPSGNLGQLDAYLRTAVEGRSIQ